MANKHIKPVTIEDLEGHIIQTKSGNYVLYNLGKRASITRVEALKLIEQMDVEAHNNEYLSKVKQAMERFDEEGYNEFGFNKEGLHRNGKEFSDAGYNAKGWILIEAIVHKGNETEIRPQLAPNNFFTGTLYDMEGYDKEGYNKEGYNKELFDRKGIHKETGTEYNPEGYNVEGYNSEGYTREGLDKDGNSKEDIALKLQKKQEHKLEVKQQQTKTFLGLVRLAKGYALGQITTEDYLKGHKISIEELIDFAKKQHMDRDTITGLYRKKAEYNKYKKMFKKDEYLKMETSIDGVKVTPEMVDKVLDYLKANDRLLSQRIVSEHLRAYINGTLDLSEKKNDEPTINEYGEIIRPNNTGTLIPDESARALAKDSEVAMKKDDTKKQFDGLEASQENALDAQSLSDE